MALKDKILTMSEEEQLKLLATDVMLVKRPLVISRNFVLVGFKENEWQNRPLEEYYPFIFMDAIHYKIRENHQIISKAA